ncbi:MAG: hypothetical protein JW941_07545 [Candidatus Coatesbacteria bacterium]|nr:hypothetical protein [Candidatus Coatesbacteria bacterium]
MELEGRTAIITGSCGKGVGRSAALRPAREGAEIEADGARFVSQSFLRFPMCF